MIKPLTSILKTTLLVGVVASCTALAYWLFLNKASDHSTKRVDVLGRSDYQPPAPDKSFYVKMGEPGNEEAIEFEVPFRIKQLWWWESEHSTEFRIELTDKLDPNSDTFRRCGFTIEITADQNRKMVWVGHNLQHSAFPDVGENTVVLAQMSDGSVLARGTLRQVGNLLWIVMPVKGLTVDAVRMFYTPSKEAFETSNKQLTMISSWVKDSQPWGNRVRRLPGNLTWVEASEQR